MKSTPVFSISLFLFSMLLTEFTTAQSIGTVNRPISTCLSRFSPKADGVTDDTPALLACFKAVAESGGGLVDIPAGDYYYAGQESIPLCSNLTVTAYGARFHLPEKLGDRARIRMFVGTDISRFTWMGGEFCGSCFDAEQRENDWEPNVETRIFQITGTPDGRTGDLLFRDIRSNGIAGGVIYVKGAPPSENNPAVPAERVHVRDCVLLRSGPFMWDYSYLWHVIVWPEEFEPWEVERAYRYFPKELIREKIVMADGDDRVRFEGTEKPIAEDLCFFGEKLPENIVRGRRYFVVESADDFIKIAEQPRGTPIRFKGASGPGTKLIHNFVEACYRLYAPKGWGGGKGNLDLHDCLGVNISGCQLSALGDTMHIRRCENVVFSNNQILGSRMGAFFIANHCKNVAILGNTVDGTNGSRVMSIENSTRDITVVGNTFRGGGRGSWINQPTNLVMTGNIFIDNTTKGEKSPPRGRRDFRTGGWESYPELYVTWAEENGSYGPVLIANNLFQPSDSSSREIIALSSKGHDIEIHGNLLVGEKRPLTIGEECINVDIRDNKGFVIENVPGRNEPFVHSRP